jgi:hypothetical protein
MPTQMKALQLEKLNMQEETKVTVVEPERKKQPTRMNEEIKREVEVSKRFKSLARGESTPIYVDQDLKQMIGDQTSILDDSSKSVYNTSNYSIPHIEEDQVTGSQFSAFVLSSGGINAICGGGSTTNLVGSPLDPLTGSLSNRERHGHGTLISNYISEEQNTDTYLVSDDSLA